MASEQAECDALSSRPAAFESKLTELAAQTPNRRQSAAHRLLPVPRVIEAAAAVGDESVSHLWVAAVRPGLLVRRRRPRVVPSNSSTMQSMVHGHQL